MLSWGTTRPVGGEHGRRSAHPSTDASHNCALWAVQGMVTSVSGSSSRRRAQHHATIKRLERLLAGAHGAPSGRGGAPRRSPQRQVNDARRRLLRGKRAARGLGALVLLALVLVAGWWATDSGPTRVFPVTAAELQQARTMLGGLQMREPTTSPKYDRKAFGPAWADEDHNGCDTRNDVLARDLSDTRVKPGTQGCVILSGTLVDAYTGETIDFVRGQDTSAEVQIDHVVALGDSWHKGASAWTNPQRQKFANDPINLLAVDGPANQEKAALDASQWVPSNKGFRCQFAVIQIRVKAEYDLWVTQAEHRALGKQLDTCEVLDE